VAVPDAVLERRRTPRVEIVSGQHLAVRGGITVRLLDISLTGVLLSAPTELEIGRLAYLRTMLGGSMFEAELRICRIAPDPASDRLGQRVCIGAMFVSLDDENRHTIQRFLLRES
jgi:hypothetical protein